MTSKATIPLNALKRPDRKDRQRIATITIVVVLAFTLLAAACGTNSESTTVAAAAPSVRAAGSQDSTEEQPQDDRDGQSEATASDRDRQRNTSAALDAHTHVVSPELAALLVGPGAPPSTADELIERLDEANVKQAVVLSLAYFPELPDAAAVRAENDFTATEVAKYPDRLIAFCGINPLRDGALDEIDRCVDELGMKGVKLHLPASGVDMKLPEHVEALSAVFDRIAERDLPVLMHSGAPLGLPLDSDAFANLGIVIATHPTVRLTMAHCTNDTDRDEMEIWLAGLQAGLFNNENMFVGTSSCLRFYKDAPRAQKQLMVWRLRTWGIDRVLFASDYLTIAPDATPADALETLKSYPFTRQELRTILNNDGSAWLNGDGQ